MGQKGTAQMDRLNLAVEDKEDLQIVSACLQDSVTRVQDFAYLSAARRFAVMVNRFRWEAADRKQRSDYQRVRTGLHFENVLSAQARNIAHDRPDGILNLLAIEFEETEAPSGIVTLIFSGGGEMRLEVEALEAHMRDLPLTRRTPHQPDHDRPGYDKEETP